LADYRLFSPRWF